MESEIPVRNTSDGSTMPRFEIETLIIGAGPAGASLACFLASHGITGLMITKTSSNADTPRAHIVNAATIECLRDIGLEEQMKKLANDGERLGHVRWGHTLNGREWGRVRAWGNHPQIRSKYEKASPCTHFDLPQTLMEPILVRYATLNGFKFRFDTEFISFEDHGDHVVSMLKDGLTNEVFTVRSRYLFGADGGRSRVVQQLDPPMHKGPSQGIAINILAEVDLGHIIGSARPGLMHGIMQPDHDHPAIARKVFARMIQPYNEWLFVLLPDPAAGTDVQATEEEYIRILHEAIGEDVPIKIKSISKWYVNEICAETYSRGNVFCLGDAVHRHPPSNALGSNTCIQDAFNLAWKVAYVLKGKSGPTLLDSYNAERIPVGMNLVRRANEAFRGLGDLFEAIGVTGATVEERTALMNELEAATPEGRARRQRLQLGFESLHHEYQGLGIEMNQLYDSRAIFRECVIGDNGLAAVEDLVLEYAPSTYPGRRLPHAWLSKPVPDGLISTIDLAGKGRFTLFTGIGGDAWVQAAPTVASELDIDIRVVTIGYGQEFIDPYFEWVHLRGVEEDGAILVRPDRFVAWRADRVREGGDWAERTLRNVLNSILAK